MKAGALVFLSVSLAMLMHGTGSVALSGAAPPQTSSTNSVNPVGDHSRNAEHATEDGMSAGKHPGELRNHRHVSGKNPGRSRASVTKPDRTGQLLKDQKHFGNASDFHQQVPDKSQGAAVGAVGPGKGSKSGVLVRPPVRSDVASLNSVRHRGANPAVVVGSVNSKTRNTGSINGTSINETRMNRR
jgi:hypothetical protein